MRDKQGRTIDYLRISLTDRCNLRCRYCMPHGVEWVPRRELLSLEELWETAGCCASLGIRHIKLTGGEPLVRRGCTALAGRLKELPGIETVTLTTNGLLLEEHLEELREAGVDGINISLDTLNRERYEQITGTDGLSRVMHALSKTVDMGLRVKINAVTPQVENDDWRELAELAVDWPVAVRFIEMMPIGYGKNYKSMDHVRLLRELKAAYPGLAPDDTLRGWGPARYWSTPRMRGSIGLISALHGKFCGSCNRVRLTAQGYLKACLCYETGADLREILRGEREGRQERLRAAIAQVIEQKPAAHCFEAPEAITEAHGMNAIGG